MTSNINQTLINNNAQLQHKLEEREKPKESQTKVEEIGRQIHSPEQASSSKLKRKAEKDIHPKGAKKAKNIAAETLPKKDDNDLFHFYPHLISNWKTMTIEVPRPDEPPLKFALPRLCFTKVFSKTYAKLLKSESSFEKDTIVWDKKELKGVSCCYYHPEAAAHIINFAACSALKESDNQQYKTLAERDDAEVVEEILQDVLDLARLHEIEALEKECVEFVAKRIPQDPSRLVYYCGFVCQSKDLQHAWKRALFHTPWTDLQKQAATEHLICALNEDLLQPQINLIYEALVFLLTKEAAESLSAECLETLNNALSLLNLSQLSYLAGLIAKHPLAHPLFSLFTTKERSQANQKIEGLTKDLPPATAHLFRARWHLANEDYQQSLIFIEKLMESSPSNLQRAKAYQLKAENYFAMKQFDQALKEIDQAICLQVQDPKIFKLKAKILFALDQLKEAIDCLEKAYLIHYNCMEIWENCVDKEITASALDYLQKRKSKDLFTLGGIASFYLKLKKSEEALEPLNEIIKQDPYQDPAIALRAGIYAQTNKLDSASADFQRAIEINPNSNLALAGRAALYRQQGHLDLALVDLNHVLQLAPQYVFALEMRGDVYRRQFRFDLALSDLNHALQINPRDDFALARRGDVYRMQGHLDLALPDLNLALQIAPHNDFALATRRDVYRLQGRSDLALADLNQVLQLNPRDAVALATRGDVYRAQGHLDLALADLNQALQVDAHNEFALATRGDVHRQQGRLDLALSDIHQALQLAPHNAVALETRGDVYRQQGHFDLALADLHQALQLAPHNAVALGTRGEIYRIQGRLDLALADLNQALQLDPHNASVLAIRGDVYRIQGHLDMALADLNLALQLNPRNDFALETRGDVYRLQGRLDLALQT